MKFSVRNFRKIQTADLEINGITLVVGKNEQGKTSLAQALTATLLNDSALFVQKQHRGQLLHGEATSAVAKLEGESGSASITWPKGEYVTDGLPPRATPVPSARMSFTSLTKEDRIAYMTELLKAKPKREEIVKQLEETGLDGKTIIETIARIELSGWDAVAKSFEEDATDSKRAWKSITGATWGKDVGSKWVPDGWTDDLADESDDGLKKALEKAEKDIQEASRRAGFDEGKRAELEALVKKLPDLRASHATLKKEVEQSEKDLAFIESEMAKFPTPDKPSDLSCPACGVSLRMISGKLAEEEVQSPEHLATLLQEHKMVTEGVRLQREATQAKRAELATVMAEGKAAAAAVDQLKAMKKGEEKYVLSPEEALEARDALRQRSLLWRAYHNAYKEHKQVLLNLLVAEKLGPSGIRFDELKKRMKDFNEKCLAPLASTFCIDKLAVNDDMSVVTGEYPYHLLSAAAQFYTNALLQIAFSKLEKAEIVILDGADIVVGLNRAMMLTVFAKHWGKPALITMSLTKPEAAPTDRETLKVYWVEGGVTKEI